MSGRAYSIADVTGVIESDFDVISSETDVTIDNVDSIYTASKGDLTFCSKTGSQARELLDETESGLVVTFFENREACEEIDDKSFVLVARPKLEFGRCVKALFGRPAPTGVDDSAKIAEGCDIGEDVYVGPNAVIDDDVTVGDGTHVGANARIYHGTRIRENVKIYPGAVIGGDGFSFDINEQGDIEPFPQMGTVTIEDGVVIGPNTTVMRATLESTVIREDARINGQVQVGHNVEIGRQCVVNPQSIVSGSVTLKQCCWISPGVSIKQHTVVGERALVGLGAVVTEDVEDGAIVVGVPAKPVNASHGGIPLPTPE
ncbi:UDP-3-O-[3-hydroxymyristoyl] glucosamine N-acyltransferase [Halovenus aranensis]|uniref:UDP-3-O-[3-hydroxymyristoyl] glucosamine N-acyltransferase n=1 Tax=Halovenus aranensis TaxID=890420 RepID=A0A1G8SAL8_9EURY|nr:DapH/DapD/GlmU-related protein [Halovenus aranensis]SDJ26276.1 UDP-3-O-[3-hydroxymyristoyl] glucosamine N-acyltransferase [Halovenus aranensis]